MQELSPDEVHGADVISIPSAGRSPSADTCNKRYVPVQQGDKESKTM